MEPWRDVELLVTTSSPALTVAAHAPALTTRLVKPALAVQVSGMQVTVIVDELL